MFKSDECCIHDTNSEVVKAVAKERQGLYCLPNYTGDAGNECDVYKEVSALNTDVKLSVPDKVQEVRKMSKSELWHLRLGHAPYERVQMIEGLDTRGTNTSEVCNTCPIAKQTKLSYGLSESRASRPFELINLDIWGPYRANARGDTSTL